MSSQPTKINITKIENHKKCIYFNVTSPVSGQLRGYYYEPVDQNSQKHTKKHLLFLPQPANPNGRSRLLYQNNSFTVKANQMYQLRAKTTDNHTWHKNDQVIFKFSDDDQLKLTNRFIIETSAHAFLRSKITRKISITNVQNRNQSAYFTIRMTTDQNISGHLTGQVSGNKLMITPQDASGRTHDSNPFEMNTNQTYYLRAKTEDGRIWKKFDKVRLKFTSPDHQYDLETLFTVKTSYSADYLKRKRQEESTKESKEEEQAEEESESEEEEKFEDESEESEEFEKFSRHRDKKRKININQIEKHIKQCEKELETMKSNYQIFTLAQEREEKLLEDLAKIQAKRNKAEQQFQQFLSLFN